MNTAVHHLPMPAGMAVASPMRRSRTEMWSAPDPRAIVLDPWAPPRGQPIASMSLSPWPAPRATARIAWMAAPPAVLPPPTLSLPARSPDVDRALAALRALAAHPDSILAQPTRPSGPVVAVMPPLPPPSLDARVADGSFSRTTPANSVETAWPLRLEDPLPDTIERVGTIDPPIGTTIDSSPVDVRADDGESGVRWHVAALVAGAGAAAAATIALLVAVL
jgi:hypothetical protein